MTNIEVGEFIRSHRKRCGLSQEELGSLIDGVHQHTISEYELGKRSPSLEKVIKILDHIGCELIIKEKEGFIYQEDYI